MLGRCVVIILHLAVVAEFAASSEILFVLPVAARSHHLALQPIYRELSLRGHNVTAMAVYPLKEPSLSNLTEIDWSRSHHLLTSHQLYRRLQEENVSMKLLQDVSKIFENITEDQFLHTDVQELLSDKTRRFDLVILENMAFAYYHLAERYDCPLVIVGSMPVQTYDLTTMGAPNHPVLYPDINLGFVGNLTFLQRILSVAYTSVVDYSIQKFAIPPLSRIATQHIGLSQTTFDEIPLKYASLLIETKIPLFHKPRSLVPNIISVNGLHIQPGKPLPKVIVTNK